MSLRLQLKYYFTHFSIQFDTNIILIENTKLFFFFFFFGLYIVGSQIVAHTLIETGNGPNRPNTIDL